MRHYACAQQWGPVHALKLLRRRCVHVAPAWRCVAKACRQHRPAHRCASSHPGSVNPGCTLPSMARTPLVRQSATAGLGAPARQHNSVPPKVAASRHNPRVIAQL
eukprot:365950-Chlamydomonas_euryale.AAC.7